MFSSQFGVFSSFSFLFLLCFFVQQEWKFSELLFISFYDIRSTTMIHITCVCLLKGRMKKEFRFVLLILHVDVWQRCFSSSVVARECNLKEMSTSAVLHFWQWEDSFCLYVIFSVKRLFKWKFDIRWEIFWLFCFWNSRKMSEK